MQRRVRGLDMVRLVTSGTEATMSAVRVARGATGRDKLIKFEGCYHGHADCFLIAAGSGMLDIGTPDSPGVPQSVAADTLVAGYNDPESVRKLLTSFPNEVAAIIVEPVGGNAGCIPPQAGFLEELRRLADEHGAILIFDEVMTGFRVARGGAAERFGITPDLFTFGKVIGGGFPIGAYGGRRDLMERVAPSGGIYQAGTLSGNPVAVAAGLATLELLNEDAYTHLESLGNRIEVAFAEQIVARNWPITLQRVGSMYSVFFTENPVTCFRDIAGADLERFSTFFHALLADGYYIAPSAFECSFLSLAHTEDQVGDYLKAAFGQLEKVFDHQPEPVSS
jgi:glutamate-1-semialdehyde 2,1-aminomutase